MQKGPGYASALRFQFETFFRGCSYQGQAPKEAPDWTLVRVPSIIMFMRVNTAHNSWFGLLLLHQCVTTLLSLLCRRFFRGFDLLVHEQDEVKPDGRPCSEVTMTMVHEDVSMIEVGRVVQGAAVGVCVKLMRDGGLSRVVRAGGEGGCGGQTR